jgi:membrane protein DedA with SNARE-associated domain
MHHAKKPTGLFTKKEIFFGSLGIILTIAIGFLVIYYSNDLKNLASVKDYGLAGMFLLTFIASSVFSLTPIAMPYWVVTFTLPGILAGRYGVWAAVWVAVVTAVAACLAQFITFMIGYSGRSLSEKLSRRFSTETYDRSVKWMKRSGSWTIFLMTLIPNPIHLPMTIAIALLKYPPYKFMFYSFLGICLRSFIIAFAGYYGLDALIQWIARLRTEGFMTSPITILVLVIIGVIFAIGVWQLVIWIQEIRDKNRKYAAACEYAEKSGKPLLVIGGPWGVKAYRRMFDKPAHGDGDVCLDIDRRALEGHPCAVVASCTDIPFSDKSFGAIFSSHVLEHMPTTQMAEQALVEMNRVAGSVFIAYPSKQSIAAWIIRDHHIWVWQKGGRTHLQQRKDRVPREHQIVEAADKIG